MVHNVFKWANEDKPLELKFSVKPNRLYSCVYKRNQTWCWHPLWY